METKHIIAVIGACLLACILTAIVNVVRNSSAGADEESSDVSAVITIPYHEQDDAASFWDSVRRQQETTTTAADGTDGQIDDSGTEATPPENTETPSDATVGNGSTETEPPFIIGVPFEG